MTKIWHSAAQLLLGIAALALLTWVSYRLELGLTTTAFAYLILLVLLSLTGSFIPLLLAVLAVGCLNYLFAPPLFDLRVERPMEVIAFFASSLVVIGLVRRGRRLGEAVREQAGLLDLTHDTIFVRDLNSTITYWNRGAEELYGWRSAEVVGKVTHDLLHTVFPEPLEKIMDTVLAAGRWEGELLHTTREGRRIVVASRWALRQDEQGRPQWILETNNDVTGRRRAEEALRRQANLLEQTYDAILVWPLSGTITYWNSGAERLYGYTRAEAVGRTSHELLRTEHPMPTERFEELIERGGAWTGELAHWTRDGRRVVVDSRHVLVRQGDEKLVLETNRDITDRKRAEEALARVTRVTTLGEVTASLAHEVNQPLAAIINNANACLGLLPHGRALDEVRQALGDIVNDGERASAIIERVRRLAKHSPPEKVPMHLAAVVADVVALAAAESTVRQVTIRTDVAPDLPVVLGDRVQLQQVLLNLVVNGMDAMSGVGESERLLEIRARTDRGSGSPAAVVSVQDRGTGLEAAKVDSVFEAFYTTKPHGMGMGLAISRSIIEAHGGRLWVANNEGPGATFAFSLPATS